MITIILNGEQKTYEGATLGELLHSLKIDSTHIAVALNNEVIARSELMEMKLSEGDQIEIIRPAGGG